MWWRNGDEDLVEWSERKGTQLYNMSTPGTISPPCSHFTLAGVIAADLPHDVKPLQSH